MSYPESLPTHIGADSTDEKYHDQPSRRPDPMTWVCAFTGIFAAIGYYDRYWISSSVQAFIGLAMFVVLWVCSTWTRMLLARRTGYPIIDPGTYRSRRLYNTMLYTSTALVIWWALISMVPGYESLPSLEGNADKYFIAINLHNNKAILPDFTHQLTSLAQHIGLDKVFISIYESNSDDGTGVYLAEYRESLDELGVPNLVVPMVKDEGESWPYATSPQRIEFLAKLRNKAMEPIQSADPDVRLENWHDFTKVIYLNDIRFEWEYIVRLIATRVEGKKNEDYDVACAMDFGDYDFYDTWVARDICGTPLDGRWPYVTDRASQQAVRNLQPFPVSSCWNGAVVFNSRPFLYGANLSEIPSTSSEMTRRGWRRIDDGTPSFPTPLGYTDVSATDDFSQFPPPLEVPLRFRPSNIEACDHSEAFLFSYDLHRLYAETEGRPRILINPAVQVAYEEKWFYWNNVILRRPIIKWWTNLWSHNIAFWLLKRPFEKRHRVRDYCTWAALKISTDPNRCPALPGDPNRHWYE